MAKINYYLKGTLSKEKLLSLKKESSAKYNHELEKIRPIICSISYKGKRLIMSTGKSVSMKHWDSKKQNIKFNMAGSSPVLRDLHDWLKSKLDKVHQYIEFQLLSNNNIDQNIVKHFFDNKPVVEVSHTFSSFLITFLKEHKTQSGFSLKNQTKKKYKVLVNHIVSYQGNDSFQCETITTEWIMKFKTFLTHDKELNDNSVSKYIRALKTLISGARKKGYAIPATLEEIKAPEKEQIVNIIEEHELEHLRNFNFESQFISQVRDVFIFQCYTGQRFSDIQNISKADLSTSDGIPIWLLNTQKTDENIMIPLTESVMLLLAKYEHLSTPLPKFSNQYFNRMVKDMARAAGLKRVVKQIAFNNNVKTEITMPLHELISSHMARKTFISLSLKKKMPERYIRAISGHKNEKSFRAYVSLGNSHITSFLETWN